MHTRPRGLNLPLTPLLFSQQRKRPGPRDAQITKPQLKQTKKEKRDLKVIGKPGTEPQFSHMSATTAADTPN